MKRAYYIIRGASMQRVSHQKFTALRSRAIRVHSIVDGGTEYFCATMF